MQALGKAGYKMAYSRFIVWHPEADGHYLSAERMFSAEGSGHVSDCALVTGCTYEALLNDCMVWTSTVLVEKAALDEAGGFDEALEVGEDYDLWLRLSRTLPMLGLEQPTALYRQHPSSVIRGARDTNYEYLVLSRALALWGPGLSPDPSAIRARLAYSMFNHGYTHYKSGNPRMAALSFLQCMKHGDSAPGPCYCSSFALPRPCLCRSSRGDERVEPIVLGGAFDTLRFHGNGRWFRPSTPIWRRYRAISLLHPERRHRQ